MLHHERHKGKITSDASYRAWKVSNDSIINIWCGTIDGTGEEWIEVQAKVDERVDTEIAKNILRALGIRSKAEETRVEHELINGKTTRNMHATVSKKSAEQIGGKTFTADDEGLATPIKVIFGGKSSAEPIEVDGSGKEKIDNDVEIEDADISPTPQKIETPKSKKKKKRKKRSPTNDQTDQSPDVVHREKALRQGDTGEHSGQTVEVGDIFRAPKLSDLDGEYFFSHIVPFDWQKSMTMGGRRIT